MDKSKPDTYIYPWLLRPHAFAFDDDATGFVFRSAMNLERHGSLKRKKSESSGLFDTYSLLDDFLQS